MALVAVLSSLFDTTAAIHMQQDTLTQANHCFFFVQVITHTVVAPGKPFPGICFNIGMQARMFLR